MRNLNRLYRCRDPNALRFDLPNNIRLEPLHNFEHYQDQESFQTYVRREIAPRVRSLLTRQNATWDDLHRLLSKAHLKLEKGESGGYTVLAIDHNIRVKASDVFRNDFAGRINRQATETALGPWALASTSGYEADQHAAQHCGQHDARNSALREERKALRHAERNSLMAEYNQYRNQQRAVCKGITAEGRDARQHLMVSLRQKKEGQIRASAAAVARQEKSYSPRQWPKLLSKYAHLKLAVQQRRQEAFPKNLRTWVAEQRRRRAMRGQRHNLRGWRYADQRNQRRLDASLETNAMHIGPPPDHDSSTDWADLAQQRLAAQQKQQALANQIAAPRIWKIDRKTGDVSYALNGQVSVIDRGRIVTVLNQDKAAVLFGLEMAVHKYGSRIACDGSVEWKRMVTKVAAQQGISVQFTDPEMLYAMRLLQRLANPRQRQQERGGR
jgi:hypothetical protein